MNGPQVNVPASEGAGVGGDVRARGRRADMAVSPDVDMEEAARRRTQRQSGGRGYR